MRKILSISISVLLVMMFSMLTFAVGEGNIDGGGGSLGQGNSLSYWNNGNEGVRVTVVRASDHTIITSPIDFTNRKPISSIYHFGNVSKVSYNNGYALNPVQGGYKYENPVQAIPTIISSGDGSNNIEALKRYFCSEYTIKMISDETGMNYDILISGDYKLLLEPLVYMKFQGVDIVATATEAALYDQTVNGLLRDWMRDVTHKNLPLAMFLEVSDLGYPAWGGSRTAHATNSDIISSLGLGIVRFEEEPEKPNISMYDYEYRVNTEVITAIEISGGQSDPDNPVEVSFNINGKTYNINNIYYPKDDSQFAWVKWTTPGEPQDMVITVNVVGGSASKSTLNIKIVDLDENPPPNPVADDRNDAFSYSAIPQRAEKQALTWTVWKPWWQPYWVDKGVWQTQILTDENGDNYNNLVWVSNWQDLGWWEFECGLYYASLNASMQIIPDNYNPTSNGNTFKSGYGINQTAHANVNSNQSYAVSKTPNAVSYFPEFNYETYWRLLERMKTGTSAEFQFKNNVYSTYKNRTHFTPIWYPDGAYTINTYVIDYWTPSGMLSANLTGTLTVQGNLWQDWWIGPKDID